MAKSVLKQLGVEEDRLWLRFISASEGKIFGDTITEMVAALKKIGPNPLKNNWEI